MSHFKSLNCTIIKVISNQQNLRALIDKKKKSTNIMLVRTSTPYIEYSVAIPILLSFALPT